MRIRAILVSAILLSLAGTVFPQERPDFYDNYTVIPNQPATAVIGLFKDSQGFIWASYISGIYRYDGVGMKHYKRIPGDTASLSDNLVRSFLFEDSLNRIWVSNFSNNIDIIEKNTGKVRQLVFDQSEFNFNSVAGLKGGCLDANGNIIGYALDGILAYFDLKQKKLTSILIDPVHPDSSINKVTKVYKDRDGNIWIGTWSGLFIYKEPENSFKRPDLPGQGADLLNDAFITDIFQDDDGVYWYATSSGLFKSAPGKDTIIHYHHIEGDAKSISHNIIVRLHEYPPDSGRTLLLHTWNGFNFFDKSSGTCRSYLFDRNNPAYTHVQVFYFELVDETGRVWLTTDNKKLIMFTPREDVFKSVQIRDETGYNYIGASFCKDEGGNLWVGTAYGGLFRYGKNMNLIERYQFKPDDYRNNFFIYSLLLDGDNMWMGFASRGLGRFNIRTGEFEHVLKKEDVGESNIFRIYNMLRDRFGIIWFCSVDGLFYTDSNDPESKLNKLQSPDERELFAMTVYEDDAGNIWFAAPNRGLYCLPVKNRADKSIILFDHREDDPKSLPSNQVSSVCQDTSGNYWIGSDVGLIRFFPDDSSFSIYKHKYSQEHLAIGYLKRDNTGNLWFFSDKGIVRFSPFENEENTFRAITRNDGMPFTEFYPWEFHIDRDGIIYCGGVRGSGNGFFYFDPKDMERNTHIPPVVFTSFRVRNEEAEMDSSITVARNIALKYHQNHFSFEFAALDYVNPQQNQYAYMLEGYDEDWIYSGNRNFVNYTGVPPGEYTFRVKGSNNDGLWNETGNSIRMTISPPPWKTWWAYTIYGIAFISLIIAWRRYDLKRQKLKQALEIEQVEAEKLKELDKMKSQFFANISHEFRTPLTLILGPLEKFSKKVRAEEDLQDLNIMQRNARRMQTLINQLLNLSKIESGQMKLQAWEEDIVSLTRGYIQSFESLARQQQIRLGFRSGPDYLPVYIDRDKIEKILYNLLSNAIKFNRKGGRVDVGLERKDEAVLITISDTGPGIPPEQLEHIFDRFYSAANSTYQEGTGIGLALTKELVALHHGSIRVESEAGNGTTFTVTLPLGKAHLTEKELVKNPEDLLTPFRFDLRDKVRSCPVEEGMPLQQDRIELVRDDADPVLLMVEDNADLRAYIRGFFEKEYQLIEAVDGLDGFEKAVENLPDIIISDVMMPKMDGFALGQKLKSDPGTSHIPLILLTARASTESKLEGLETGADDFITKPFDPQELQIRVKNLIAQRKRLAEYYRASLTDPGLRSVLPAPPEGISALDQQFLEKAIRVVKENMTDADFGVEEYSSRLAMSRIHLHRKLKGLLNQSPSDLIRTIRLKQAATLLKQHAGNVTQVAYEVGFNNLSYFAKCFQEEFGCLPSEYR